VRTNLPITQHEYPFPSGQTVVSITDLKGRITHCNEVFIQLSGFTKEELLGQPHNLVRHPDVPEEAFRDLWATLEAGLPWTGIVKNRRKNGDHYWVVANATPLMEGDRPVAYLSVRTEPTREQIEAAEGLYAVMRAEQEASRLVHRLSHGALYRDTWTGRMAGLLRPTAEAQTVTMALVLAMLGMGTGVLAAGGWDSASPATLIGGLVLMAVLALMGAWRLHALTISPLKRLLGFANRMAAGDLTCSLESQSGGTLGQLERALNQLNVNIRSIVSDARTEVDRMGSETHEIAQGNRELSERTQSQGARLEDTAASMEQISGNVKQTAEAARQAAALAGQATRVTERSGQAVQDVTQNMHAINESSKRIGEIVQVIDSIAFQTNLLALNAAVEAARAGEQGRGFAVVAAEVRQLATRSSGAAREIAQLIQESSTKVVAGTKLSDSARQTMEEAVAAARQVNTLISEIHTAVDEQLIGIEQVNEAMVHMDELTQQNNQLVHNLACSGVALDLQARGVADAMRVFRLSQNDVMHTQDAVSLRREMKQLVSTPARAALMVTQ
jgi:aerotaxis receptor